MEAAGIYASLEGETKTCGRSAPIDHPTPRDRNSAGIGEHLLSEDGTRSIRRAAFKALPCPMAGSEVSSGLNPIREECLVTRVYEIRRRFIRDVPSRLL